MKSYKEFILESKSEKSKFIINKFNSSKVQFFFQNKLSFYSKVKNLINNYL